MADFRTVAASQSRTEVVNAFMRGVYGWMTGGLFVTAVTAFMTATSPTMIKLVFGNSIVLIGLILAELGLVVALSAAINRLSKAAATSMFLAYSALNGVTLSSVLLVYTGASVLNAFLTCSAMFGAMSVYGLVTKKDLTGMGSFMFMGLIGIVIASIVNIFLKSPAMHFVISAIGVIVFTGLTAYDTQKWRNRGMTAPMGDSLAVRRGTIMAALELYLDFVNLFLMLLRLFGSSRD